MGINATLLNNIMPYILDYDLSPNDAEQFLLGINDHDNRQKFAIEMISGIMSMHGKKKLRGQIAELARVEHGIKELEPWARDHVAHAVLSFILGMNIYEEFLKTQGIEITDFQWKLASLFHDIAYPAEFASSFLEKQTKCAVDIKKLLGAKATKMGFKIVPYGYEDLNNGVNAFELIQDHLVACDLKIDVKQEYQKMIDSGQMCHGIMSSLIVLNVIDQMYQTYNPKREYRPIRMGGANWNQANFENEVVPACSAIFVHNLKPESLNGAKIDMGKAPLVFLLRLSDNLQDWNRPKKGLLRGYHDDQYDITYQEGKLIFKVENEERRNKIKSDLEACLVIDGIKIVGMD